MLGDILALRNSPIYKEYRHRKTGTDAFLRPASGANLKIKSTRPDGHSGQERPSAAGR